MKNELKVTKEVPLPRSTATQKLAWLGAPGSGKTYGSSKFAEELWNIGAQFVTLDPVGVWYGLRLDASGKKPSHINLPIFGGLHGDVPLEPTAGALIADLVIDKGLSCVIDVSQFEHDTEKARFAKAFGDRFFFRKKAAPSAVHLFLEEAQEFVPQNPQRGEEGMLHTFVRIQKLGRNFGIGTSYISQRPQEVNKKALNMAQTLFVFRNTGPHERKAIETWIKDKDMDESVMEDLPKIPTGQCHVWSPEFLGVSERVHILEKKTFNASATPEVGAAAKARKLAPIDLDKVRSEMAATIEKAKAEDPKELQKTIADLKRELAKKPLQTQKVEAFPQKIVDSAVKSAILARDKEWQPKLEAAAGEIGRLSKIVAGVARMVGSDVNIGMAPLKIEPPASVRMPAAPTSPKIPKSEPIAAHVSTGGEYPGGRPISGPEQRILDAIAWLNVIGVDQPNRVAVAFIAGYSSTSSSYVKSCGGLRTAGLVEYAPGNLISLTSTGRVAANTSPNDAPTSNADLHEKIYTVLSPAEKKILKPIVDAGGDLITKTSVATLSDYSETSSSFVKILGKMRTLGLIDYAPGGHVRAEKILFPI